MSLPVGLHLNYLQLNSALYSVVHKMFWSLHVLWSCFRPILKLMRPPKLSSSDAKIWWRSSMNILRRYSEFSYHCPVFASWLIYLHLNGHYQPYLLNWLITVSLWDDCCSFHNFNSYMVKNYNFWYSKLCHSLTVISVKLYKPLSKHGLWKNQF